MSIYEFLERLNADPFDPALTALFLGKDRKPAQQGQENDPPQDFAGELYRAGTEDTEAGNETP